MILLETERLLIRNWRDDDRDLFREINRDPKVMEFFPWRRSREEADILMDRLRTMIGETGLGFYALEEKESGEPVGFCGIGPASIAPVMPEETIEIGWRLATRYWGKGYATEAARAVLEHAFADRKLDAVLSFAVAENTRSTAVMRRIGLRRLAILDFDHPRVPETHPHLKRHVVYGLTRDAYLESRKDSPLP
ncbi:GNAT family N-acetyltransferase [Pseudomonas sp. R2.Fl]|nr:GNAT family N-acetyltransferase [Pseudomonas sp. R2.Fl]